MKKKIFIIIILTLLLAPIKFNKGILINKVLADPKEEAKTVCEKAADGLKTNSVDITKEQLVSICTERLLATECKTENCFKNMLCADKTYAPLTTLCDNDNPVLTKVCHNAVEEIKVGIPFDKSQLLEYCMTSLGGTQCTTAECYKKLLCDSSYGAYTSYCDKKVDDSIVKEVCEEAVENLKEWALNGFTKEEILNKCISGLSMASCTTKTCYKKALCNSEYGQYTSLCDDPSNPGTDPGTDPGEDDIEPVVDYDEFDAANCYGFGEVVYYISLVIKIFQIAAPILLIIWASIDLVKSIISNEEKKIIEKRKPIIQRFVAAGVIFLVPWIVETIVNGFSVNGDEDSWYTCWENNHFKYSSTTDDEKKVEILKKYDNLCSTHCKKNNASDLKECNKSCRASFHNEKCDKTSLTPSNLDSCILTYYAAWYKDYFDEYLIQPK